MHKPTPEQQAIIDFISANPDTNLMIEAVAGAAKTSTMVMSAPGIGEQFFPLAIAFNKRNAEDLQSRMPSHFSCLTLNALGHRAWQSARGKRLTLDADKMYSIVKAVVPKSDNPDDESFIAVLTLARTAKSVGLVPFGAPMGVKGLAPDHPDQWQEFAFVKGVDCDDFIIQYARDAVLKSIAEAFQGRIDFDDQIYMSVLFGGTYPKHHTVIVDESQDLSPLNHRQLLKCTTTRLIAVGDPCQAIYAFRGADASSMENLAGMMGDGRDDSFTRDNPLAFIGKGKFHRLSLTKSFRVPHAIGRRQTSWVPHFGTMDFLPEGTIEHWPAKRAVGPDPTGVENHHWSLDSIPADGFVLCRNNAPLMRLAFAMIKRRRAVKILGRDIGASLASALLRATGKEPIPITDCYSKLNDWKAKELEKCGDSESKRDVVFDRVECLQIMLDAEFESNSKGTNVSCAQFIRDLFSDRQASDTTLSSGHRAKGLESKWVMHLDPFRCPSKQALRARDRGDDRSYIQEMNLNYVIETRSQGTLVLANLEDCMEIGE